MTLTPIPKLARLDAPGVLHHIMIRGIGRRDIFKAHLRMSCGETILNRFIIVDQACQDSHGRGLGVKDSSEKEMTGFKGSRGPGFERKAKELQRVDCLAKVIGMMN